MSLILQILKSVPLFQNLTEEEHQTIIAHITMQYFPAHYVLFKQNEAASAMYIIKSGMVRIFDANAERANLGEGDFFGEMALIEDQPRNASAETLSDCEIFVLNKEDFSSLLQKSPEIFRKISEAYQKRKQENSPQL